MRYSTSEFKDIPRDRFLQALRAEGVPAGTAHNDTVYQNPIFVEMKSTYGTPVDYSEVHCPVAERVYRNEIVALGKDFLMERRTVDLVLDAIRKKIT